VSRTMRPSVTALRTAQSHPLVRSDVQLGDYPTMTLSVAAHHVTHGARRPFAAFSSDALILSGALTTLCFTAGTTSGATRLSLTPTEGGAEDDTDVLARLIPRGLDVYVASQAKRGHVSDDSTVSIIDAHQIARYSVVLTTPSSHCALPKGRLSRLEAPSWAEGWQRLSSCLASAAQVVR
jgi:hypothetical protein